MENNNVAEHNKKMKDAILKRIQREKVTMRPKAYFTLKLLALILVAAAILFISVLLATFILFSLRINGHESLLGFGSRGFFAFLHLFPWMLLIIDGVLIIFLEWLLKKFKFGYKSPTLYLLLGILVVTAGVAIILDRHTPLNDRLLNRADVQGLPPPLNDFYEGARRSHSLESGVCRCTIVDIQGNILLVKESRNESTTTVQVVIPFDSPFATTTSLRIGDQIFIFGDIQNGIIEAVGIRPLSSEDLNRQHLKISR